MKYQFVQAVHIEGRIFTPGVHEVPEKIENHAHFLKFVGAGYITEAEAAPAPLKTPKERTEALLDKLIHKKDAKVAKVSAKPSESSPVKEKEEEPASEAKDEDSDFYDAPNKKLKKK